MIIFLIFIPQSKAENFYKNVDIQIPNNIKCLNYIIR